MEESSAQAFERQQLQPALERRRQQGSIRRLRPFHAREALDFSSNDYLGLARSTQQHSRVEKALEKASSGGTSFLGSTGSRLLTGDSVYAQNLEKRLARWHRRPAALLCNSGYDANLSVLSCLTLNAVVLMDELAHNSMQMGVRLSKGYTVQLFRHNHVPDLQRHLKHFRSQMGHTKPIVVVVESVYSMDGDIAPLVQIMNVAQKYGACVIVDEAHGLGVFGDTGMGVLQQYSLENHPSLLCSVHTFGKAAGCHGAVVCGSPTVKEFLLNYARPIIYSTSLPLHSLVTIACSYESMTGQMGRLLRQKVRLGVQIFRTGMTDIMRQTDGSISLVDSISPIQAVVIPGNTACVDFCERLWVLSNQKVRLYPIRAPTVPKGQERVRIIVHAHNSQDEIEDLLLMIKATLSEMKYFHTGGGISHNYQSKL